MNNDEMMMIPYIVYESAQVRADKRAKWHFAIIIVLIVALVGTNALWIYEWNQYDYAFESVDVDASEGNASYVNGNGSFVWQESK